jgi:uncharacterized protein (TIGR00299 family) protein
MKIAYFDCFAGASGDMILGSLVDAGLDPDLLNIELSKLRLSCFTLSFKPVQKRGIAGTQAVIDMDPYLLQPHRGLSEIVHLIQASELSPDIREKSIAVFTRLAEAEAKVHRTTVDAVHFHEVGAVDAIIDVVGAVSGMSLLGIQGIHCSALHLGSGTVTCVHGVLPVPAPATLELIRGVPAYATEVRGELLTPTGAAILTTLAETFGPLPPMIIEKSGYGAGMADPDIPNLLRVIIGRMDETAPGWNADQVAVIETAIDDMNPQIYDHVMERALAFGALDIYLKPVQMKKNRPGILLTLLCQPDDLNRFARFLLTETTSIGLRWRFENRIKAEREIREMATSLGPVRIKTSRLQGDIVHASPEFEDCRKIALSQNIPLKTVIAGICRENAAGNDANSGRRDVLHEKTLL